MKYYIFIIFLILVSSLILKAFPPGWEVVDYSFNRFYWDVKCIDSMNCMALSLQGSRQELRKSKNGGLSWKQILPDSVTFKITESGKESYGFLCFDFLDENKYYLGADSGIIFKTMDGGITWEKIKIKTSRQIIKIKFYDEKDGLCLTPKELFRTKDGGLNWFNVAIPDSFTKGSNPNSIFEFYSLQCPDSTSIKIHYYFGNLYFLISDDRGETWSRSNIPKGGILSYYFLDRNNGWLVQYYQTSYTDFPNVVQQTTDGGYTWNKSLDTLVKIISGLKNVFFLNINEGIACGENGVLFRTKNGGKKWDYLLSWKDDYPPHYRCCIQPSSTAFMVFSDNGYILRYDEKKLSVDSELNHNNLAISPNPAGEYIEITGIRLNPRVNPWVDGVVGDISIYNVLGECVMSARANVSSPLHINVSSLPSGIYFVRLGNWTGSFLKIE